MQRWAEKRIDLIDIVINLRKQLLSLGETAGQDDTAEPVRIEPGKAIVSSVFSPKVS